MNSITNQQMGMTKVKVYLVSNTPKGSGEPREKAVVQETLQP